MVARMEPFPNGPMILVCEADFVRAGIEKGFVRHELKSVWRRLGLRLHLDICFTPDCFGHIVQHNRVLVPVSAGHASEIDWARVSNVLDANETNSRRVSGRPPYGSRFFQRCEFEQQIHEQFGLSERIAQNLWDYFLMPERGRSLYCGNHVQNPLHAQLALPVTEANRLHRSVVGHVGTQSHLAFLRTRGQRILEVDCSRSRSRSRQAR